MRPRLESRALVQAHADQQLRLADNFRTNKDEKSPNDDAFFAYNKFMESYDKLRMIMQEFEQTRRLHREVCAELMRAGHSSQIEGYTQDVERWCALFLGAMGRRPL
jgi:hypothetical protein